MTRPLCHLYTHLPTLCEHCSQHKNSRCRIAEAQAMPETVAWSRHGCVVGSVATPKTVATKSGRQW